MALVVLLSRLVLAAVFAVAAVSKLLDRDGARTAMREFGVPAVLVPAGARLLPLLELACAAALLVPASSAAGAMVALALLALFIVGIVASLARGRRPNCRCFGQLSSSPVGWVTVARNVVLAAMAAFIAWPPASATVVVGTVPATLWLGAALAAETVLGTMALFHLLRQNGRLMLRLEAVEAKLGIAPAPEPIPAGLPVGVAMPDVALSTLDGAQVRLRDAAGAGRALLLFIDAECSACDAVVPELAVWERDHAHVFRTVVLSGGSVEANRVKLGDAASGVVLLQRQREAADRFEVVGTPAAVIVEGGRIASAVAAGPEAIRALAAQASKPAPLKPGDPVPSLPLRKLDGGVQDLREIAERETVLLFWNPSCGYCQSMLDEVKAWERERTDSDPELVVISAGSPQANREQGFRSPVLLDAKFLASERFGADGTPSAVLVGANGRIASDVHVGAPPVLSLMGATVVVSPAF